jgi:hypothetical protein
VPAGGSTMLVLPIHGQPDDVLSDIISNLKEFMRRRLNTWGTMLVLPIHGQPDDVLSDIISNLKEFMRCRLNTWFFGTGQFFSSPGDDEINQTLLWGVQGGDFLEKSPPGRRRQKVISWKI